MIRPTPLIRFVLLGLILLLERRFPARPKSASSPGLCLDLLWTLLEAPLARGFRLRFGVVTVVAHRAAKLCTARLPTPVGIGLQVRPAGLGP